MLESDSFSVKDPHFTLSLIRDSAGENEIGGDQDEEMEKYLIIQLCKNFPQ